MVSIEAKTALSTKGGGLPIALAIVGGWATHLSLLLSADIASLSPVLLIGCILLQTFLNTGLFITAHDAIHGLVFPECPSVNGRFGHFCAMAYAALPYQTLAVKHLDHHRYSMSAADPDFYAPDATGESANFWAWYLHFISQYWTIKQLFQLAIAVGMGVVRRC